MAKYNLQSVLHQSQESYGSGADAECTEEDRKEAEALRARPTEELVEETREFGAGARADIAEQEVQEDIVERAIEAHDQLEVARAIMQSSVENFGGVNSATIDLYNLQAARLHNDLGISGSRILSVESCTPSSIAYTMEAESAASIDILGQIIEWIKNWYNRIREYIARYTTRIGKLQRRAVQLMDIAQKDNNAFNPTISDSDRSKLGLWFSKDGKTLSVVQATTEVAGYFAQASNGEYANGILKVFKSLNSYDLGKGYWSKFKRVIGHEKETLKDSLKKAAGDFRVLSKDKIKEFCDLTGTVETPLAVYLVGNHLPGEKAIWMVTNEDLAEDAKDDPDEAPFPRINVGFGLVNRIPSNVKLEDSQLPKNNRDINTIARNLVSLVKSIDGSRKTLEDVSKKVRAEADKAMTSVNALLKSDNSMSYTVTEMTRFVKSLMTSLVRPFEQQFSYVIDFGITAANVAIIASRGKVDKDKDKTLKD